MRIGGDCLLLVGTYTHTLPHVVGKGAGIHILGYDSTTGAIYPGTTFKDIRNPTWLTANRTGDRLYAIEEMPADGGAAVDCFALDRTAGQITPLRSLHSGGSWPCHASLDAEESRLFISNYMSGSLAVFRLDAEGIPLPNPLLIQHEGKGPNAERQEGPHVHQCIPTPDGKHVLVCEAGADRIFRYPLTGTTLASVPDLAIASDPGGFPRHLAFLPDGSGFLVINELSAVIDAYAYENDAVRRLGAIRGLPAEWRDAPSGAAIRVHPSGRFAYVSNRGHDSIFGIDLRNGLAKLKPLGWWSTAGHAPRDIAIDGAGRFLLAANQNTDTIVTFQIDGETGTLKRMPDVIEIGTPVCLLFVTRD